MSIVGEGGGGCACRSVEVVCVMCWVLGIGVGERCKRVKHVGMVGGLMMSCKSDVIYK